MIRYVYEPEQPYAGDAPRLTLLALFYNQRHYAAQNVQAALAQSWPNCELVFSDDCSPDGTGEELLRLVADYRGPHRVVVNVNEKNLGVGGHCRAVFPLCSGEWIATSGGDDWSAPDRLARIAAHAAAHPGAAAIGSAAVRVDGDGCTIGEAFCVDGTIVYPKYCGGEFTSALNPGDKVTHVPVTGAVAAYRRDVIGLAPIPEGVIAEDVFLSMRAILLGDVLFVPEKLVYQRFDGRNLSVGGRDATSRAGRTAYRRKASLMAYRSVSAILAEAAGYGFEVGAPCLELLRDHAAALLLMCFDKDEAQCAAEYAAAYRRAVRTFGRMKVWRFAFERGLLFRLLRTLARPQKQR